VRLLREEGAYFGKNKAGWYFGYKLHVLAHTDGMLIGAFLTPANWDDRDVVAALAEGLEGNSILLADLAYRDARELEPLLRSEYGIVLVTPAHAPLEQRALISRVRERIETVFSCLWQRFVDRVFSRCFEGLWSAVKVKMLHYTIFVKQASYNHSTHNWGLTTCPLKPGKISSWLDAHDGPANDGSHPARRRSASTSRSRWREPATLVPSQRTLVLRLVLWLAIPTVRGNHLDAILG
jgi:hypothetical protein